MPVQSGLANRPEASSPSHVASTSIASHASLQRVGVGRQRQFFVKPCVEWRQTERHEIRIDNIVGCDCCALAEEGGGAVTWPVSTSGDRSRFSGSIMPAKPNAYRAHWITALWRSIRAGHFCQGSVGRLHSSIYSVTSVGRLRSLR